MKLITILLLAFTPLFVLGQGYFEGRIHYMYEIKAKSKKIDLRRFEKTLGKGSTLLFRDGNFRQNYEGGLFEFDLYNRPDNRLYRKERHNDTIYWYDCSKGGKSIRDLKVSTQKKTILGIVCDQLDVQYQDYSHVEYYNSDSIRIDPQWFAKYKRNDQYKVDAIQKSILLRSEHEFPAVSIITQAIKVQRETISPDVFKIPANTILREKE
jgi:hypothetical protein